MSLALRGATYTYAGARAPSLVDVDLELPAGRVVGVIGPNEAGKSTLCLVASGLAPGVVGGRLEGAVTLDGRETRELRPHEHAQRCGVLFQNPTHQLSGTALTVLEEVAFGPRNLSLPAAEVLARAGEAMAALGIDALADRDPARLSGGQAQLVALASILALRPAYLVLDEPTSQLDPQGTRIVGDALARLAREGGAGILVVEHKTGLLDRLADEVVLVEAGRITQRGPTADVLADPDLATHGVEPPPATRVRGALARAGLALPSEAAAMLAGGAA